MITHTKYANASDIFCKTVWISPVSLLVARDESSEAYTVEAGYNNLRVFKDLGADCYEIIDLISEATRTAKKCPYSKSALLTERMFLPGQPGLTQ